MTDPADIPESALVAPADDNVTYVVTGHEDTAKWSVPLGVRTASEWAWRAIVIAAAIAGVIWILTQISEIVIPVIVALLLAALLTPIHRRLKRVMPSGLASTLTVLGTLALIIGALTFVTSQFVDQFDDIRSQVGQGYDQIRAWIMDTFGVNSTKIDDWIEAGRAQATKSFQDIGPQAAAAGATAGHAIAGFFVAMFTLFFFFLHDGRTIWGWVVSLFPRSARDKVASSGVIAWGQLSAFTRATIMVAAVDAIGIGAVAGILGVPFASGVAILVFFGAFIPVIGAAISGAVAVLLALVALGPVKALIMLAGVIAVQQIESHLLQPLLLGRAVKVHPLSVILAIAGGVVVAGIVGALIAVPLVAVLNAVGHHLLDDEDTRDAEQAINDAEHSSDKPAEARFS